MDYDYEDIWTEEDVEFINSPNPVDNFRWEDYAREDEDALVLFEREESEYLDEYDEAFPDDFWGEYFEEDEN